MATKTNIQKLQSEAKKLGIEGYELMTEAELSAKIEEVKKDLPPTEEPETAKEPVKKVEGMNVAVVKNDEGREVRRYTLDIHGKDFASLAEEFADKNGYEIVLVKDREFILCPGCGRKIYK